MGLWWARTNIFLRGCHRQKAAPLNAAAVEAIADYPRSLSDSVIKAVAQSGGVCSINMVGAFVDMSNPDTVTTDRP